MDALRRGGSTAARPAYPEAVAVDRDIVGLNVDYVAAGGRSVQVLPQTPNALSGDGRRQRVDKSHAGIIALGSRRRVGRHRQQGARKTEHQQRSHGAHVSSPDATGLPVAPVARTVLLAPSEDSTDQKKSRLCYSLASSEPGNAPRP